jgi:hypothetical protein
MWRGQYIPILIDLCETWDSHSDEYGDECLLRCEPVSSDRKVQNLRRKLLSPSSTPINVSWAVTPCRAGSPGPTFRRNWMTLSSGIWLHIVWWKSINISKELNDSVFWNVTPYSLVERYQHFEGTCTLHLLLWLLSSGMWSYVLW